MRASFITIVMATATNCALAQVDLTAVFLPPTASEIETVRAEWAARFPSAPNWTVVATGSDSAGRTLQVVRHDIQPSGVHFAAIRYPLGFDPQSTYPVMLCLHGGNDVGQRRASLEEGDFSKRFDRKQLAESPADSEVILYNVPPADLGILIGKGANAHCGALANRCRGTKKRHQKVIGLTSPALLAALLNRQCLFRKNSGNLVRKFVSKRYRFVDIASVGATIALFVSD